MGVIDVTRIIIWRRTNRIRIMSSVFWAKTVVGQGGVQLPGISVYGHCLNVGCVAEAVIPLLAARVQRLLPIGSATLAALHDIGKITLGFQAKCPAWLAAQLFDALTRKQIDLAKTSGRNESDHAYVSQLFVQDLLRATKNKDWAVAVGAHHGKPKTVKPLTMEPCAEVMLEHRHTVAVRLIERFGALPVTGLRKDLGRDDPAIWLLAGLITFADWIGSNELFFPAEHDLEAEQASTAARAALLEIGWPGGRLKEGEFSSAFAFAPNAMQDALLAAAQEPALYIVEAPMGCGKTEAALGAARQLIAAGQNQGFYFALPTQVTSNRIHLRVLDFLRSTLADAAHLRLAHANSWLESQSDLRLRPSVFDGSRSLHGESPELASSVDEARSWFASSKQALLAPYGVGTIDQALQGMVAVKHFFVRRFALAGKVVILDEVHAYDVYTGTLITALIRELRSLGCSVIILSATLTAERRRELLQAAGCRDLPEPTDAYPLVSVCKGAEPVQQICPEPPPPKPISLRVADISEDETIAELIARAEAGQHVLWIRNTVVEAQQAFRCLRGDLPVARDPEERIPVGLLHSRYPLRRRQELENFWLNRLGKHRPLSGPGSILVATQVVEQSVDIDLDFIVSDLAPTDMLLQRAGRLWRHPRSNRAASKAEFWVRTPTLPAGADLRSLLQGLGRSARVYAPWVLLRTASTLHERTGMTLPGDIRPLLEATYAPPDAAEPQAWHQAAEILAKNRDSLTRNAEAAMLVLGRPMVGDDAPEALTRPAGPPTKTILLLAAHEPLRSHNHRLTTPEGTAFEVSDFAWSIQASRFIHPWLVRVPSYMVPAGAPSPDWLRLHVPGGAYLAVLGEQGRLLWEGEPDETTYHPDFGVLIEKPRPGRKAPSPATQEFDDDEFDY